ncbi:MAG: VOC family protein [Anaerolineaceae bacterium]|nr:VOC family protein [Anaerolineaceae bacterium]
MPTLAANTRLVVVSIRTNRLLETVHFYRDVVGLAGLAHHGQQPAFDLGNGAFLVIVESQQMPEQPATQPRFPLLAFAVEDVDAAAARLKELQVQMPWGIESNSQNRWIEFYDPGGNLIEFAQFSA